METLLDAILQNPNPQAAIHFVRAAEDQSTMRYEELSKRALGLLAFFQERGMGKGDELLLVSQRNEAFLEGFWAAVFGGNPAVPLSFGIADEHKWKLFRIWKQLTAPWLMIDAAHVARIDKFAESNQLENEWEQMKKRVMIIEHIPQFTKEASPAKIKNTDTAIIQFSSGTTSLPKGVVLSHQNLITNLTGIGKGIKMTRQDSTFSWMPLTHDMGLIGFHLTPLLHGVDQYLMPTEVFIRHPLLWLEKVAENKATVTCSPNFGYKHYLNAASRNSAVKSLDLRHLRIIFNGAEPISVPLIEAFMKSQEANGLPAGSMFTVYGLAEASLAVAFPEPGIPFRYRTLSRASLAIGRQVEDDEQGVSFVIEGRAVAGCTIRVTDQQRVELPVEHVGKIEIKGDNVTKGYLGQEELNAEVIQEGWLDTGDLGLLTASGELIITGRAKDIIFINGQNYYPHDIEQVLEAQGLAEQGKVAVCAVREAGKEEETVLVFLLHKGAAENFYPQTRAVKKLINEHMGIEVAHVIPISKLPKTTSGKVQRYVLGEQYLEGDFQHLLEAFDGLEETRNKTESNTSGKIEQTIQAICDELITDKKLHPEDNIFEIGTTSLVLAQIHQRIEELYPGRVEVTDFFDYPTIKQLAAYIEEKGK